MANPHQTSILQRMEKPTCGANGAQGGQQDADPFGSIVEMLALTGQRRDEVGRMAWEHLDLQRRVWIVPGEHAKNGKPHLVQLSKPVLALLEAVPRSGELVFSGDGTRVFQGYSKAKARLDRLSGVNNWTLHDLRRTVVSGIARLGVVPHVADKILNHQGGTISGVAAVYQRHEFLKEREWALQIWGDHVQSLRTLAVAAINTKANEQNSAIYRALEPQWRSGHLQDLSSAHPL